MKKLGFSAILLPTMTMTLTMTLTMTMTVRAQDDDMYFTKKMLKSEKKPIIVDNSNDASKKSHAGSDIIYLNNGSHQGLDIDVDAYNRRGKAYKDSFTADSMSHDTIYVTRRIEFIDNGWYDPWYWRPWCYDPWFDPWFDPWYDPWFYPGWRYSLSWRAWHDPWWHGYWGPVWYRPARIVGYVPNYTANHYTKGRSLSTFGRSAGRSVSSYGTRSTTSSNRRARNYNSRSIDDFGSRNSGFSNFTQSRVEGSSRSSGFSNGGGGGSRSGGFSGGGGGSSRSGGGGFRSGGRR